MEPLDPRDYFQSKLERALAVIERMRGRDVALVLPLMMVVTILLFTASGFFGVPSTDPGLPGHAETYRSDAEQSEQQRCGSDEKREAPTGNDAGAGKYGHGEAEDQDPAGCLSRLSVREAIVANEIALRYNGISADAAWWSRLGGILVTVLGIASVVGVMVATFAASDARRAIDYGFASLAATRRSSRAYLTLGAPESGIGMAAVRNKGSTPARMHALRVAHPSRRVDDLDPSVLPWTDDATGDDVLGVNRRPTGTPYRRVKGTPLSSSGRSMLGAPFALVVA